MRLLSTVLVWCCLSLAACSPPPEHDSEDGLPVEGTGPITQPAPGPSQPLAGRYIVVLREPEAGTTLVTTQEHAQRLTAHYGGTVVRVYSVIRGFSVKDLPEPQAHALAQDPAVKYVEKDTLVTVNAEASEAR